jgi:hypothetical protein
MGAANTTTDAAINAFVFAAAAELKNDIRLNVAAPGVLANSAELHHFFPGQIPVSAERVAAAYLQSILGIRTGNIYGDIDPY